MAGLEDESVLLANLEKLFGSAKKVREYQELTKNSERIDFVYHAPMVTELFKVQLQAMKSSRKEMEDEGLGKSESETTRWRELGNQAFKVGKDVKAMEHYSLAMIYAPKPYEKCNPKKKNGFALAAANRSAVHVRLGHFNQAIQDIDLALKTGDHPSPAKLVERRELCLEKLGRFNEEIQVLEEVIEDLSNAGDLSLTPIIHQNEEKIKKLLIAEEIIEQESEFNNKEEEALKFKSQKLFPALSTAIKILYTPERGRYGVAARDIQIGEALVVENPVGSRIKSNEAGDHCDTCLKYCFGSQIPCPKCVVSCFCSVECLNKAQESFHQHECLSTGGIVSNFLEDFLIKLKGNEGAVNYYRLCFRLICQQNLEFFKENQEWIKHADETFGGKKDWRGDPFLPEDYKSLLSLVRHVDSDTTGTLIWVILSSAFQLRTLQLSGYFGAKRRFVHADVKLEPDELFMGQVIIHIFQLLRYNAHGILEQIYCEVGEDDDPFDWHSCWKTHSIATGIYPSLALLNHSCDPNISKYFVGAKTVALANRVIFKGEEITENYYPYYSHMPRKERIPWLYDHYRFTCTCVACNGHYPIRRDLKENHFYLRCQQCRTPLKALHDKSEIRCTKCNHIEEKSDHIWVRVHDLEKEIEASQHLFHRDLDESNLKELLVVTSKRCGELSSYLCAPTKMLQDALEWNSALNRRLKCSRRTRQE